MELLELWRRHLERTKSERTTITYLNAIKSFLKKLQLPSYKLVEVSSADLYQYADSSELSPASLLTHFSALRHFYRFLARRGYIEKEKDSEIEEAIEDIKEDYGLKVMHRKPKALSKSELEKIFQKVKGSKYENVYKLFLYSGVRLSEYKNLSSEHFFLDKSGIYWLHLPAEITKRKKERIAPLIGPTKEETFRFTQELSRWLEDYDANLRVKAGSLQVYTNRLSKRLGIDFSLHSFRHTYITNLINQGFPAELVKEFAGHANVKTTIDIYYRFNQERARAEELLSDFGLYELRNQKAGNLSGGQKRRLEIARALIPKPKYLFFDEPFAGIDPIMVADIKELILNLKAQDIGILITDHNVRETIRLVDRVYIISEGTVIAHGPPKDVILNQRVREVYLGKDFHL